jgi:flagellar biosynthesis/type III secretory pathway chaperone
MDSAVPHAQLQRLLELICRERDCAKRCALEEMAAVTEEKELLLRSLGPIAELDGEGRALVARIRSENRRNAYLFWSALKWVRESMSFFGQQTTPIGYSARGGMVGAANSGLLLSGRV